MANLNRTLTLPQTNSLVIAATDADLSEKRIKAALIQLDILKKEHAEWSEKSGVLCMADQNRFMAIENDLRSIISRIQSIHTRVRSCLMDGQVPTEDPSKTEPPKVEPPKVEPPKPTPHLFRTPSPFDQQLPTPTTPPPPPGWPLAPPAQSSLGLEELHPTETSIGAPKRKELFEGVEIEVGVSTNGGYKHWRSRREIIAFALNLGVPVSVILHPTLLGPKTKPSNLTYKRVEKLLIQFQQIKESNQDPSPLWATFPWPTLSESSPKVEPSTDDPTCP